MLEVQHVRGEKRLMPLPIAVRLVPHDPRWAARAEAEAARVQQAAGSVMLQVHHMGSTAIPGIAAKPILDLLGVASDSPRWGKAGTGSARL